MRAIVRKKLYKYLAGNVDAQVEGNQVWKVFLDVGLRSLQKGHDKSAPPQDGQKVGDFPRHQNQNHKGDHSGIYNMVSIPQKAPKLENQVGNRGN